MADKTLQIVITARDLASVAFQRVQASVDGIRATGIRTFAALRNSMGGVRTELAAIVASVGLWNKLVREPERFALALADVGEESRFVRDNIEAFGRAVETIGVRSGRQFEDIARDIKKSLKSGLSPVDALEEAARESGTASATRIITSYANIARVGANAFNAELVAQLKPAEPISADTIEDVRERAQQIARGLAQFFRGVQIGVVEPVKLAARAWAGIFAELPNLARGSFELLVAAGTRALDALKLVFVDALLLAPAQAVARGIAAILDGLNDLYQMVTRVFQRIGNEVAATWNALQLTIVEGVRSTFEALDGALPEGIFSRIFGADKESVRRAFRDVREELEGSILDLEKPVRGQRLGFLDELVDNYRSSADELAAASADVSKELDAQYQESLKSASAYFETFLQGRERDFETFKANIDALWADVQRIDALQSQPQPSAARPQASAPDFGLGAGARSLGTLDAVLDKLRDRMRSLTETTADVAVAISGSLSNAMSTAFDKIADGSFRAGEFFRRFALDVVSSIHRIIAAEVALRAVRGITQLAFSGFSAPAQGAGTFTFSGESARHGAVFSGSYLPMRAFSEGGISRRPTIGMISEGGKPEAVIPLSRGREIPVRLDGGNNIGSPIVVFNVSANDAASFNQQLLRQETRRTIQAIMEEGFAANRRLSARGRRL